MVRIHPVPPIKYVIKMKNNPLKEALTSKEYYTLTENNAITYNTTNSGLLDLFAMGGALRTADKYRILSLFSKAMDEDKELAIKLLFYLRDIREGQGERRTFRIILNYLGNAYPSIVQHIIGDIPFYGRFDDVFSLLDTNSKSILERYIYDIYRLEDINTMVPLNVSGESDYLPLYYKWFPSINGSKKHIARKIRDMFRLTSGEYRRWISYRKALLHLVETKMCEKQWKKIDYNKIPSYAMLKHTKAFKRNDLDRFLKYLEDVANKKKNVKINVSVLYPYDIIRKVREELTSSVLETDVMWNNQKDWTDGSEENVLVVCDTSGSMFNNYAKPMPIDISTSLAIYFAERNKGAFHNTFISFSNTPKLITLKGKNILEKYGNISQTNWASNTDLQRVFDLILSTARQNGIKEEDMPKKIIVISDMEFDECGPEPNMKLIEQKYEIAGYKLPTLVFWNVQSRQDNVPIMKDNRGIVLVSGSSPSTFKMLMKDIENFSPMDLLKSVLLTPRYERIHI